METPGLRKERKVVTVLFDLVGFTSLALFGAPIAHEDDPERAVRAARSRSSPKRAP